MPESQHTLGPWTVRETEGGIRVRCEAECLTVAEMHLGVGPQTADLTAARADARLIAAAPDLLAACESALIILAAYVPADAWDGHCDRAAVALKDALKKAKGE